MVARQKGLALLSRGIFTIALFVLLFSMASAYDCNGMSWWLRMEEDSGGVGTYLVDACSNGNDFSRMANTTKTAGAWNYGQFFNQSLNAYAEKYNTSAETFGSRSWRTIFNATTEETGALMTDEFGTFYYNFLTHYSNSTDKFSCYCRDYLSGPRAVTGALSPTTGVNYDILCSYNSSDTNLSIYINGALSGSNIGNACNLVSSTGHMLVASHSSAVAPKINGILDEAFYKIAATTPQQAYCYWKYNNANCTPPPIPFVCLNAALYTTQGFTVGGFNDSDNCYTTVSRNDTTRIVETHTFSNDCVGTVKEQLSSDCYIYPIYGLVSYTLFLGEKYSPGLYIVSVRCGNTMNNSFCFVIQPPSLEVIDFNEYPQLLTTMKFSARSNSEKTMNCMAKIIDNRTVVSQFPGVKAEVGKGVFTFEHFLLAENAYKNYTLNITCDDYSTWQSEFKPVFANINIASATIFGISIELIFVGIAIILAGVLVVGGYYLYKTIWGVRV